MNEEIKNPKLIAKNGFYLFVRLLLVMLIGFYATRLTLGILGDEEFGISNIVAGLISTFAVVSMPITSSLQRFFNVEFTKGIRTPKVVFSTTVRIIILLSLCMFLLYETIGLFLVNKVLQYPVERKFAVNVIFQLTVLTSIIRFMIIPYSAILYSKENMGTPATVEVAVAVFRLIALLLLPFIDGDYLILYSVILLLMSAGELIFYFSYCYRKYEETHLVIKKTDKSLQKEILSFSGWNAIGAISGVSMTHLSNIFVNVFGGVLYNTAYGISYQLSNAVVSFSTNVLKVIDPQVTKATVASMDDYRNRLALFSIKLTVIATGFVYVMFCFEGSQLLAIWLKNVPDYAFLFCRIAIFNVILSSVMLPLRTIVFATGNIKRFFISIGISFVIIMSIMFVLLKLGSPVVLVMYMIGFYQLISVVISIVEVNKLSSLRASDVVNCLMICFVGLILYGVVYLGLSYCLPQCSIYMMLSRIISSFFAFCAISYLVVLKKGEKKMILNLYKKIINKA